MADTFGVAKLIENFKEEKKFDTKSKQLVAKDIVDSIIELFL